MASGPPLLRSTGVPPKQRLCRFELHTFCPLGTTRGRGASMTHCLLPSRPAWHLLVIDTDTYSSGAGRCSASWSAATRKPAAGCQRRSWAAAFQCAPMG